jgi:hypothetical protein
MKEREVERGRGKRSLSVFTREKRMRKQGEIIDELR